MQSTFGIVVLSHLRWDFVYQRPQHLLARLAKSHRVLFVEEPIVSESAQENWQFHEPLPNLTVCRPLTSSSAQGFEGKQLAHLKQELRRLVEGVGMDDYILWFYTPMALPVAEDLKPVAVVYDCMDELSAFMGAPPALNGQEERLLEKADLVFTGGPSLYRAKQNRHPRVYCFPSSVDERHFAQASNGIGGLRIKRLWRIRAGLLWSDRRTDGCATSESRSGRASGMATRHGRPVVKIDPATLPRAAISIISASGLLQSCRAYWPAGTCAAAVRPQRGDALHQPHQDAGIHGGRETHRQHAHHRRGRALRRHSSTWGTRPKFLAACERALDRARPRNGRRAVAACATSLPGTSWDADRRGAWALIDAAGGRAPRPPASRRRPHGACPPPVVMRAPVPPG